MRGRGRRAPYGTHDQDVHWRSSTTTSIAEAASSAEPASGARFLHRLLPPLVDLDHDNLTNPFFFFRETEEPSAGGDLDRGRKRSGLGGAWGSGGGVRRPDLAQRQMRG